MRSLILLLVLAGCNASGPPAPATPDTAPSAEAPPPDAPPVATARDGRDPDRPALDRVPDLVHREANDARRAEGVGELRWRDDLAAIATAHSRDMAARDYFDHATPEGTAPNDRALAAGIDCRLDVGGGRFRVGVAENLYQTTAYSRIRTRTVGTRTTRTVEWLSPVALAEATVRGWLESPGHRANLLAPDSRAHGIGVAERGETLYVTQVLC